MKNNEMAYYATYCKWPSENPSEEKGIIVATDISQEWLLPWWWEHYSQHNNLLVSFVDFGMSKEMKAWCIDKGNYIPLPIPDIFVKEKDSFSKVQIELLEKKHGSYIWDNRNAWFKKPLACLQSPYKTSLWVDLDCEVRGALDPILSLSPSSEIRLAKHYYEERGEDINSGVIVFKHGSSLIEDWAKDSFKDNHLFVGDQDVLRVIINNTDIKTEDLPPIYNWSRFNKENPEAIIIHWHGNHGKTSIAHQIAKRNLELSGFT